ncbi:MAG: iron chaperone [Methanobacterium sp.]
MKKNAISKEKTKKETPTKDVDEYISSAPKKHQEALKNIRNAIREAAPQAEELISYRIPSYKYHGSLVHFAAFKNHCSFIVVNKTILETFKSELEGYYTSGATIRFTALKPLPEALVKKIVKKRMEENEMRAKK